MSTNYTDPAYQPQCDGCQYLAKPHIDSTQFVCPCSCHLIDAIEALDATQVCKGLWAFKGEDDYRQPAYHIVCTRVLREAGVSRVYEFSGQEILDTIPGDVTMEELTDIVAMAHWNKEVRESCEE